MITLTKRQLAMLRLAEKGETNAQIAARLGAAKMTIENRFRKIRKHMNASGVTHRELMGIARKERYVVVEVNTDFSL